MLIEGNCFREQAIIVAERIDLVQLGADIARWLITISSSVFPGCVAETCYKCTGRRRSRERMHAYVHVERLSVLARCGQTMKGASVRA